ESARAPCFGLGEHLDSRSSVGQHPITREIRREALEGYRLCPEHCTQLVELCRQKARKRLIDSKQDRVGSLRQLAQVTGYRRQYVIVRKLGQSRHDFAPGDAGGRTDLRWRYRSDRLSRSKGHAENGGGVLDLA